MAKFTLEDLKSGKLGDVDRVTIMSLGSKDNRVYGNCTDGTATMKYTFFDIDWLKEGDIVNVKSAYYKTDYNSLQIKKGGSVVKAIQPASKGVTVEAEEDYDTKMIEEEKQKNRDEATQKTKDFMKEAYHIEEDKLINAIGLLIKAVNDCTSMIEGFKQVMKDKSIEVVNKGQAKVEEAKRIKAETDKIKEELKEAVAKNEAKAK